MDADFRPATFADLETILPLMRDYYAFDDLPFDEAKARRALAGLLANPDFGLIWMIERGGVVAGYMAVCFGYSLEYGGRDAFVDELYLKEAYRGQGIGRRALAWMVEACRARGVQALHLEVTRDNAPAIALYRRMGFEDHDHFLLSLDIGG